MADIPAGTGMGSSGSFTTALLKALYALIRKPVTPRELAEQACRIEIDILGEPIGADEPRPATFEDGVAGQAVLDATRLSAAEGRSVRVADLTR